MSRLFTVTFFARTVHRVALITLGVAALALSIAHVDLYGQEQPPMPNQPEPSIMLSAHTDAASPASAEALQLKLLGRILGHVEATYGGHTIALPGATLSLEDQRGQVIGETTQSNVEGYYEIPSHPPGAYVLCAD